MFLCPRLCARVAPDRNAPLMTCQIEVMCPAPLRPPDTRPRSVLTVTARRIVPAVFAIVMIVGFGSLVGRQVSDAREHAVRIAVPVAPRDPQAASATLAGQPALPVPSARRVTTTITTIAQLRHRLPAGTIVRAGTSWRVERSIAVARHGVLRLTGVNLQLAPTSYLESEAGGTLWLARSAVTGIRSSGRTPAAPVPRRGFLLGAGGRLVLRDDRLLDLGHFADGAYGVTFRSAAPGSELVGSTITNAYGAVRVVRSRGVVIAGNRVIRSHTDAIQVTSGSGIRIADNLFDSARARSVVVSARSQDVTVVGNDIRCTRQYGVVVNDQSPRVTVTDNHLDGCFDGIALTDSSGDTVTHNVVIGSQRFGLRLTHVTHSSVRDNLIIRSLVGIYAYGRSGPDQVRENRFIADTLDVRVREDTRGVVVRPLPTNSVIGR